MPSIRRDFIADYRTLLDAITYRLLITLSNYRRPGSDVAPVLESNFQPTLGPASAAAPPRPPGEPFIFHGTAFALFKKTRLTIFYHFDHNLKPERLR